jgi:transposase-like protein
MRKPTTIKTEVARFRRDIDRAMRERVRDAIEVILDEELTEALGCPRHDRTESRLGYRNGRIEREITMETGLQRVRIPRGRLDQDDGSSVEFRSQVLPRYARRTRRVDEAILGVYLAGGNSRRIRKALAPLLGEQHLSKSAISRVVGRLKALFAEWNARDLSSESYKIVFLDGFYLKVRLARRVVSVPVLAALGVEKDGSKRLIGLQLVVRESGSSWHGFVSGLSKRGMRRPALLVTDGHAGLKRARDVWNGIAVQRCTQHKLRNLLGHCPKHAHGELKRDFGAIVGAKDHAVGLSAYDAFVAKWTSLCPSVATSLEEAGLDLLTFYRFPKPLWKGLRTTNSLENLNREFRRRTKTQGSFSTEPAAVTLLYGLIAFGQITMRRITGHPHVARINQAIENAA